MIHVKAIGAEEIPNCNKDRKSNLHLVVTVGSPENSQKTKTEFGTQYPNWDETLSFILPNGNSQMVQCIVYDSDSFMKSEAISRALLSTADFEFGSVYDNWYDLKPYKGLIKGGRLHLKIQLCPKDHTIFVPYRGANPLAPQNKSQLPPLKKAGQSLLYHKNPKPEIKEGSIETLSNNRKMELPLDGPGTSQIENELNLLKSKAEIQNKPKILSKAEQSNEDRNYTLFPPLKQIETRVYISENAEAENNGFIQPASNPYEMSDEINQQSQKQNQYQYQYQYQYQNKCPQMQQPYGQHNNGYVSNSQYHQQFMYQQYPQFQQGYPQYVTAAPVYVPPQMYLVPPQMYLVPPKNTRGGPVMITTANPMFGAIPKGQQHIANRNFLAKLKT